MKYNKVHRVGGKRIVINRRVFMFGQFFVTSMLSTLIHNRKRLVVSAWKLMHKEYAQEWQGVEE